ncbi:hypothetical protein FH972_002387 [Carpinus fangiana]|uniref:Uncharacterized protein n=1 Tax=Carpinus fangiana TaxID=176857 RepID=A0A5N6QHV6_9ROSI|nr:hypothetical protein FH972_002387 [Carpinus fangiana]
MIIHAYLLLSLSVLINSTTYSQSTVVESPKMAIVPPSASSNPSTYISVSTTHGSAVMGHHSTARSLESRKMSFVPLSAPNPDTYMPPLTTNGKEPQNKGHVPPSAPNPGTYIPSSTSSQSAGH